MQAPFKYTAPLREDFTTKGDRLIALVEKYWRLDDGSPMVLDPWQKDLLRRVLETKPDGTLRYRQVLISMGRQNGKSEIGAILQLWGLLQHTKGPSVVGMATNVKQANIVYDRVVRTVNSSPDLSRKLKATGTRGIRHKDGSGSLFVLPAKEESVQGQPVTLGLVDELHILKPQIWHAIVNGQRSKSEALVIGITTAGDITSELLLDLYDKADEAIANPDSTFGVFIWQAAEGSKVNDPDAIRQANPAIECGRIDLETVLADTANLPEFDAKRYLLNQFVANHNVWLDPKVWDHCSGKGITDPSKGVHYAIDVSPSMGYMTISGAKKLEDGTIETEIVAAEVDPSLDRLKYLCDSLKRAESFAMDPYKLADLADHLERKGKKVIRLAQGGNARAAATAYSLINQRKVKHNRDELIRRQFKAGMAKNVGDGWKIVPVKKGTPIDSLMSMVFALYAAETETKSSSMLHIG